MAQKRAFDPQFEISFYENVLKRSPSFVEALACLGDLYTKQGQYEKGLAVDERLAQLRPEDSTVFYNLSCSYSLTGALEAAERTMRQAIDLGYNDFEHLQKDPDLVNLLRSDGFQKYFQQVRAARGSRTPQERSS